jgi:hypothetical protein
MCAFYHFWLWPNTYIKMLVVTKWLITRHMLIHNFLLKMTQNNIMNFETPVCNVQCDVQNTKHQVHIYDLLQSPSNSGLLEISMVILFQCQRVNTSI